MEVWFDYPLKFRHLVPPQVVVLLNGGSFGIKDVISDVNIVNTVSTVSRQRLRRSGPWNHLCT
jgi:hypothetical protein